MATPRRSARPGLLRWLNTAATSRPATHVGARCGREEMTVRPEDTLRAAGISSSQRGTSGGCRACCGKARIVALSRKLLLRGADVRLDDLDPSSGGAAARPRHTRHSSRVRAGDGASGMRNHGGR